MKNKTKQRNPMKNTESLVRTTTKPKAKQIKAMNKNGNYFASSDPHQDIGI